jgi:hypothetical protein
VSHLICRVEPVARNRRTAPTLQNPGGEVERAEPDTELHCSPVLRSDVVSTPLRQGYCGQAGKAEGAGAERREAPPASARAGLSKAHISARKRRGSMTYLITNQRVDQVSGCVASGAGMRKAGHSR